ncbi:MAG: zeta toxin family protein [Bacteroidetes bacterium]|nr:zeta toxin family protein [Bacteroidota bacterium]
MPNLYIIAGPNGAGKTTAAFSLLPEVFLTTEFINADEIAKGLSPLNPEGVALQAGKIMLNRIRSLINDKKDFAFETTLSGLGYIQLLKEATNKNYTIILFFVWLNSFELAKERVSIRVSKGGHNIPELTIKRRFIKGIINFKKYAKLVRDWYVYDNSGTEYLIVAKSINNNIEIFNFEIYKQIISNEAAH